MRTIWKLPVELEERFTVSVPEVHRVLAVQMQRGMPFMWVQVNDADPEVPRDFLVVGTGNPIPEPDESVEQVYVGTFQPVSGLVFHVFEEVPSAVEG